MRRLAFSFMVWGSFHNDGEHGDMQADIVLEKMKILCLAGNRKSTDTLGNILSIANQKAHPIPK